MQTAYEVLDVQTDANDVEIKHAYLQHVKDNPPDQNQQKFQLIHEAFSAIKDHKCRVSYDLFTPPNTDFNALTNLALKTEKTTRIDSNALLKLLNISVESADLLCAMTPPKQ